MAEIARELVIAWALVKQGAAMQKQTVAVEPVIVTWEGAREISLSQQEFIVGVVPAAAETYAVYVVENGRKELLGLEMPGARHPDWWELAEELATGDE